jgi:hypothetical protein
LAKFDIGEIKYENLAKFGLDDNLTKEQFKEFKGLFKMAQSEGKGNKVSKKEIKDLASFGQKTALNNEVAKLEKGVDKLVPDGDELAGLTPQRGNLANLNMSIFARAAVSRARGVRGAISTSARGDAGYGRSLARISLGAM